ncbi:MAG: ABC transporter ATP-binding protein [Pseudomonadota bacterium]
MANVILDNVSIEFPIYDVNVRSLRSSLLKATVPGRIGINQKDRVSFTAIRNIDLHIKDGDRLGLIGPNGAGKTTLLKAISGIYEPAQGSISISGKIATLFDLTLGIDYELTGRENVFLRGLVLGMTRRQIRRQMEEIEEFAELGESFNMPVRTYSSGMQMRLAFAVSTSIDPEILLIDEAIGAGDLHFMQKADKRIASVMGLSRIMVLASHSLEILRKSCTKGVFLREGRIEAVGPIEDVIEAYRSTV